MQRRAVLAALGAGSLFGLAGCGGTDGNETGQSPTTGGGGTTGGGTSNQIRMVTDGSDFYFDPIGLFVEPGTTVTWVNASGAHSSTAYVEGVGGAAVTRIPQEAEGWNSETISEVGSTFQHTFDVEGTYDYFCIPHKANGMVGRLVVGEPGGPAAGSDPPDGTVPMSSAIVEQGAIGYDEFIG